MWAEITGLLVNLDHYYKIERNDKTLKLKLFTSYAKAEDLEFSFDSEQDLEQAYFNLLETLKSKPVDGFREY